MQLLAQVSTNGTETDTAATVIQRATELAGQYVPALISAALTLILGWIAARIITGLVRRVMGRARLEATLIGFLANLVYIALIALVVITALGKLGVPTGSFVAVIGAAGLAIGFALQGSLGNLASGVMLIFFRPFHAGDYVEAGGTAGIVEDVQIFATTMRTGDNKTVVVPNSAITGGTIVNYSRKETRRVDMVFGIGYGDDMKKAKQIITDILTADTRVLSDPEPTVAVSELADSSVNIVVRPWVNTGEYWPVKFDLTEQIKTAFDQNGISIPFPQRDVHLFQAA